MSTIMLDDLVSRWSDPTRRPLLKGRLIDSTGNVCAQGDILRWVGWTDDRLRVTTQDIIDKEVSKLLNISLIHSILLRISNDHKEDYPQKVLTLTDDGIGSIIGNEWKRLLKFGKYLDTINTAGWKKIASSCGTIIYSGLPAARSISIDHSNLFSKAGHNAGILYVCTHKLDNFAFWAAPAVSYAVSEIQDHSKLEKLLFLPMFGFNSISAIDKLPK